MFSQLLLAIFRVTATLFAALPLIFNLYFNGSMVMSFIYMPMLSLVLAAIFVSIDSKLAQLAIRDKKPSSSLAVKSTSYLQATGKKCCWLSS